jgi:hypothetical protein
VENTVFERLLENAEIIREMEMANYNFNITLMDVEHQSVIRNESAVLLQEGVKETVKSFIEKIKELINRIKNFILKNIQKMIDFIKGKLGKEKQELSQIDSNAVAQIEGDVLGEGQLLLATTSKEIAEEEVIIKKLGSVLSLPAPQGQKVIEEVKQKAEKMSKPKEAKPEKTQPKRAIKAGQDLTKLISQKEQIVKQMERTQNNIKWGIKFLEDAKKQLEGWTKHADSASDDREKNYASDKVQVWKDSIAGYTSQIARSNSRLSQLAKQEKKISMTIHRLKAVSKKKLKEELEFDSLLEGLITNI